ncbi:multidrug efflux transporter permease subunit MdtO [Escherichia coli]|nr:multidrug efflux transporter permease subunit MdtO [Escherichia coli]EFC4057100.1 multidrug efflux transporter permease subunit MdtO [Escherichia coli]MCD6842339.1 multidrug efflux transporter permease subunit MdtO [Escherichia coli]MCN2077474.1 multidrug efflux transporter permease subunit MdtO [Escherichia coli]MDA6852244.1 multidrug efflux transporter permease subunit MdtO [Escherichia coli]MDA6862332.1 multidrug efflux transporter permease subunit MdtO [Escherichia coli]
MATPYISMAGIGKSFGPVHALKSVNLTVYPGEIHALLGENGAGKSTLMKVLSGIHEPTKGTITINNISYNKLDHKLAAQLGIGIIYQELSVIDELTVLENLYIGRHLTKKICGVNIIDWREMRVRAAMMLLRVGLKVDLDEKVANLSISHKQMLEIAKTLMLDAKVIIMDEPTSSLTNKEVDYLFLIMNQLRKEGTAIVYISHKLAEIRRICDRYTVMKDGSSVCSGIVSDVSNDDIVRLMVGRELQNRFNAMKENVSNLAPLPETRIEREALALQKLNVFCLADDANWRTQNAWWQSCVATVTYIYSTLNRYDPTSFADSQAIIEFRQKLASEINKLQHAVAEGQCWQSDWRISESEAMAARECNLENICQTLLQLGQMDPNTPPTPAAKPPSMAADAFTNPDYMRYAVKTLLACLICYTFYSGVDWEGIHTCMLTCVIVANPNVGSSYQKMVLRFGGAFCGAILALLFTLLVMPWLDNIVELLFVLAPIFLLGAWIATSSERSSYIGTQMVVTFALATLENVFGPVYDLVEIRDRALGIIIGTVVSAVIYTFVWPESEARTLPQKLAGTLGMLSKVMRIPRQQEVTALRTYLQIRIGLHAAFNACEEMCQRVALERQLDSEERALLIERSQTVIRQGRDLLHAWDATWNSAQALDNALQPDRAGQFADALEKYAAGLATALSRSPQITLEETPASQAILPTLLKQEQHVCQLFARLPDWTAPALTPATEQAQGATQ